MREKMEFETIAVPFHELNDFLRTLVVGSKPKTSTDVVKLPYALPPAHLRKLHAAPSIPETRRPETYHDSGWMDLQNWWEISMLKQ